MLDALLGQFEQLRKGTEKKQQLIISHRFKTLAQISFRIVCITLNEHGYKTDREIFTYLAFFFV